MCGCLLSAPHWGPGPQPRPVSWLGIRPVTLWFPVRSSIDWATPARARPKFLILLPYTLSSEGPQSLVQIPIFSIFLGIPKGDVRMFSWTSPGSYAHNQHSLLTTAVFTEHSCLWQAPPLYPAGHGSLPPELPLCYTCSKFHFHVFCFGGPLIHHAKSLPIGQFQLPEFMQV